MEYTASQGIAMLLAGAVAVGGVGLLAWASIGKRWNRYPMRHWVFILEGEDGRIEEYQITTNIREQAQAEAIDWFNWRYDTTGQVIKVYEKTNREV